MRVASGRVFDVAVDMRRSSPTFGRWGVELSEDNHRQFWVPPGFAHGFVVLSETADFLYKTTDYYAPSTSAALPGTIPPWPSTGNSKASSRCSPPRTACKVVCRGRGVRLTPASAAPRMTHAAGARRIPCRRRSKAAGRPRRRLRETPPQRCTRAGKVLEHGTAASRIHPTGDRRRGQTASARRIDTRMHERSTALAMIICATRDEARRPVSALQESQRGRGAPILRMPLGLIV